MAAPVRVRVTTICSANIAATASATTATCCAVKETAPRSRRGFGITAGNGIGAEPFHSLHQVLQDERDADRGDERGEPRSVAQPAIGQAFHQHAYEPAADRRSDERERAVHHERDAVQFARDAERAEYRQRDERAQRVDVAVREIDQLGDPVHHRVADGDQRVDPA